MENNLSNFKRENSASKLLAEEQNNLRVVDDGSPFSFNPKIRGYFNPNRNA